MKHAKDETRRKTAESMLSEMRKVYVVVEGKHDVAALKHLMVYAHTYEEAMRSGLPLPERVLIFTDNDRRGIEKAEKLSSFFTENGAIVDGTTGTRLLKILNSVHVEDILQPIAQVMEREKQKQKRIGELNGENLFGYSKVYGRGKVLD